MRERGQEDRRSKAPGSPQQERGKKAHISTEGAKDETQARARPRQGIFDGPLPHLWSSSARVAKVQGDDERTVTSSDRLVPDRRSTLGFKLTTHGGRRGWSLGDQNLQETDAAKD